MSAIIDYRGKTPEKTTSGIPLVTAKVIKGGRIERPDEFISETDYAAWMRRGMPNPGDIVMTTEAPLGEVAQLDGRKVALAQRVITLRGKPGLLDNTFLKFLLQSSPIQAQLCSRSTGTTVVGIRQSELRKVRLTLPPFAEQQAIAGVLGALDDKIESNRRTSQTLERVARAIFRAWFVDFEPVKAKAAGARSFPGMPQEAFDALPACLVESELGPVPEGWEVGEISDIAILSRDAVDPQEHPEEMFDHLSIPAFDDSQRPVVEPGKAIKSNKLAVTADCLLVSKLNPRTPRVWLPPKPGVRRQIASTEFLVTVLKPEWRRSYLFCLVQQQEFVDDMAQRASGTSNSHQRVKPTDYLSTRTVLPVRPVREAFEDIVWPLLELSQAGALENAKLAALRDYLLPKLLSGKVRVAEEAKTEDCRT